MWDPKVLIVTHWFDPTTDTVAEELNRRGVSVFRCDAADFPQHLILSALFDNGWSGMLRTAERAVRLEDVFGIYYRRPSGFAFPQEMSGPERQWAFTEARLGFGGLLSSMSCWLNHPSAIA